MIKSVTSIPTLPEWPLLGSLPALLGDNITLRRKLLRHYPDIYLMHVGWRPTVVVSRAEYCQEVLGRGEDFDKAVALTQPAAPVFGSGILAVENAQQRRQRRVIQPAFHHTRINSYADTITAYTADLLEHWPQSGTLDVGEAMMALTMRIIGKLMFDRDDLGDQEGLGQAIATAMYYVSDAFLLPVPLWWPLPRNRRLRRALPVLNTAIARMLQDRRRAGGDCGDLLSMLLAARYEDGTALSDQQIRDEMVTIFIAGHETTALALAWAFHLLSRHPAIYARLQQEVDTVLQGRRPTLADLPNLPYTQQVFKEVLRLYPSAHTIPRMAIRDTRIGDHRIQRGWLVMVDIWSMQHRADYFPDPERFDPDRFSAENEKQIPRNAYLPFGTGPRACIGRQLALLEAHLILATITQQVQFGDRGRVEAKPVLTLRPKSPIRLAITRRA